MLCGLAGYHVMIMLIGIMMPGEITPAGYNAFNFPHESNTHCGGIFILTKYNLKLQIHDERFLSFLTFEHCPCHGCYSTMLLCCHPSSTTTIAEKSLHSITV